MIKIFLGPQRALTNEIDGSGYNEWSCGVMKAALFA